MDASDQIRSEKDGKSGKATYREHIRALFALFALSEGSRLPCGIWR